MIYVGDISVADDNNEIDLASGMAAFEEKNFSKAKQMLSPLAEAGNPEAQHRMAIMFQNGLGLVKSDELAFKWMQASAGLNYPLALHGLGFMYLHGECVDKDEAKAAEYFQKAAEQGLAGSAMTLGLMYEQGQGVKQDPDEAQKWYKKSEELQE